MTDDSDYTSPCNEVNSHGDRCIVQAWHLNDEVQPHEHRFPPRTVERVQPTRDEIARVLSQAWSECIGEADDKGADSYHFTQADAILALFSSTPTVAQVQAEALREFADQIDASPAVTWTGIGGVKERLSARADALDPKEGN